MIHLFWILFFGVLIVWVIVIFLNSKIKICVKLDHELLWSSNLRCGYEEFTGEKIDYEQTHGANL